MTTKSQLHNNATKQQIERFHISEFFFFPFPNEDHYGVRQEDLAVR